MRSHVVRLFTPAWLLVTALAPEARGAEIPAPRVARPAPELSGARKLHAEPSPLDVAEAERLQREAADLRRRLAASARNQASLLEEARRLDQELALRRLEADVARAAAEREAQQAALAATRAASLAERVTGLRRRAALVARALHVQGRDAPLVRWLLEGESSGMQVGSVLVERQAMLALDARMAELAAKEALEESRRRASGARRLREEAEAAAALATRQAQSRQAALARMATASRRDAEAAAEKERAAADLLAALRPESLAARPVARSRPRPDLSLAGLSLQRGRLPWPVEGSRRVLDRWGPLRDPVRGTTTFRHGIAIEADRLDVIRAVADGRVLFVDWYKGFGRCLVLDHGDGDLSVYAHADSFRAGPGDVVAAGEELGRAGDTGSLAGPRVWFQIQRKGESVDPLEWLAR